MNNLNIDIVGVNKIIKKVIEEIGSSRGEILQIIDNLRKDQENLKNQLADMKTEISKVIDEVDELEKLDRRMRKRLAEVSSAFDKYGEKDIKNAYEQASDARVMLLTKKNEEKMLRENRTNLELALKKSLDNIEGAEKVINQISIALGYLEGDILLAMEGTDKNSEMFIGIKILEAQENERKRIARDIHDGPAQHMANIVMKVDFSRKLIETDVKEGLKELESLKEDVRKALREVRNIIYDLRPMSLDDLGLNQTIQETVKTITQESGIDIKLRLKPIQTEIEPIIQVAVYRIIQEVFNNIKKHSRARHAEVKLDFGTKYLMLVIWDNGIGFNVEETLKRVRTKGNSYGLIGIYDRVNQLQGDIQIKSQEGSGTTYTVRLPINREVIKDEKRGN